MAGLSGVDRVLGMGFGPGAGALLLTVLTLLAERPICLNTRCGNLGGGARLLGDA